MKGDTINTIKSPKHQLQDHCPPKKSSHLNTEISLEMLEILLTSTPEENNSIPNEVSFDNDNDISLRKNIDHVIAHKQHYLKRINHLKKRKRGAEWLSRNLSYFHTHFPWEVISQLENMAHQSNNTTDQSVDLTIDSSTTNSPSAIYPTNSFEDIQGLQVLTNNIRRLIYNNLESPLQQLSLDLIEQSSSNELIDWNSWCSEIESNIQNIENLLYDGQCFFSIRNFKLMEQLPLSDRSKSALLAIINKVAPA